MISGVTKEIDGEAHVFRFTSAAMMRLEEAGGKGIVEIVDEFQRQAQDGKVSLTSLVGFVAAAMNDGAGAPIEDAQRVFDVLGIADSATLVGDCFAKAFPEAEEKGEAPPAKKKKAPARK